MLAVVGVHGHGKVVVVNSIGLRTVLVILGVWASVLTGTTQPAAARWTEEDFLLKTAQSYVVVASPDVNRAVTVIGSRRQYAAHKGDTFFDLARYYGLGYNELVEANPGVDEWIPAENKPIELPTEWILPQTEYVGLVVNIPEMRLYYYPPRRADGTQMVTTFPVGLGRDDWRTPQGKFKVRGKTLNPTWNIPASIQKERIEKNGYTEKSIAGGSPDNPLGKHRIELTLPMYGIHGTNIPWGVGMQVSHGCIRLYPEDIEQLFPMIPVGTPGQFVYEPVKIGARNGRIYVEVHKDIYGMTPAAFNAARTTLQKYGWQDLVNVDLLVQAIEEESGVPMDITAGPPAHDENLPRRAGAETSLRSY
jgi:L,D-transpeptidase ErfK/SrfK